MSMYEDQLLTMICPETVLLPDCALLDAARLSPRRERTTYLNHTFSFDLSFALCRGSLPSLQGHNLRLDPEETK